MRKLLQLAAIAAGLFAFLAGPAPAATVTATPETAVAVINASAD